MAAGVNAEKLDRSGHGGRKDVEQAAWSTQVGGRRGNVVHGGYRGAGRAVSVRCLRSVRYGEQRWGRAR